MYIFIFLEFTDMPDKMQTSPNRELRISSLGPPPKLSWQCGLRDQHRACTARHRMPFHFQLLHLIFLSILSLQRFAE